MVLETERIFGTTILYCDAKGCNQEQEFEGFDGEVDIKDSIVDAREEGWLVTYMAGEFEHYCSEECFINRFK